MPFEVSIVTATEADSVEGDTDVCVRFICDLLHTTKEEATALLARTMFCDVDVQSPITLHITVQGRDISGRLDTPFASLYDLGPGDWRYQFIDSGDTEDDI